MALAPQRGLPVPPMPVLPPEGIAPVTDPASTGTAPDASPTTMVLQYLKSRGYQPSSENVRRALEANQRDPGVIPGLRSDRPATEAEDQAAMAAAGRGGGSKNTSAPPPGSDLAHPVDLNWQTVNPNPPASGGGGDGTSDAAKIAMMALGGAGGMGALGYGAYKLADRFNPPPVAGPGAGVPPPVDPGAGVTGVPPPPPNVAPMAETQVTPFDTAMNRAVAPAEGALPGVNPITPEMMQRASGGGPRTFDPAIANEAAIASGATPPPKVPFRSDPALRTSPNLRGEPVPLRGVRPGRLRIG